jgi:hypothetical protein
MPRGARGPASSGTRSNFEQHLSPFRADAAGRMSYGPQGSQGVRQVPQYTFKLFDDSGGVEDDVGVSLPNAEIAYRYACDVVLELMDCRELRTRHWQLNVYEGEGKKVFEIPFAQIDPTLNHLTAARRERVEHGSQVIRSLKDALHTATLTGREAKSLVARWRGKPYLAADRGRKVIRDNS